MSRKQLRSKPGRKAPPSYVGTFEVLLSAEPPDNENHTCKGRLSPIIRSNHHNIEFGNGQLCPDNKPRINSSGKVDVNEKGRQRGSPVSIPSARRDASG